MAFNSNQESEKKSKKGFPSPEIEPAMYWRAPQRIASYGQESVGRTGPGSRAQSDHKCQKMRSFLLADSRLSICAVPIEPVHSSIVEDPILRKVFIRHGDVIPGEEGLVAFGDGFSVFGGAESIRS